MEKVKLIIKTDAELSNRIKLIAKLMGSSANAVINDILGGFIDRNSDAIKEFERAAEKFHDKIKW